MLYMLSEDATTILTMSTPTRTNSPEILMRTDSLKIMPTDVQMKLLYTSVNENRFCCIWGAFYYNPDNPRKYLKV